MSNNYVFCLLNCFSNYEVVASQIIQFYIENAIKALSKNPDISVPIKSYFSDTPFLLYSMNLLPGESIKLPSGFKRSKQFTDFIIILSLSCVTLARIYNSSVTVFAGQGVVVNPGFASLYTLANQLNVKTVYWTDDLRNIWGTTDDPLFIGMAPLPYKYLWTASEDSNQPPIYNTQPKGLNGPNIFPNLAQSEDLCPKVDINSFEKNWNTFIELILRSDNIQKEQNNRKMSNIIPGDGSRLGNLIAIGNAIIEYVEVTKCKLYPELGCGWNPIINTTLYLDIEKVISENLNLLYIEENNFFRYSTRISPGVPITTPNIKDKIEFNVPLFNQNGKNIAMAFANGLNNIVTNSYKYKNDMEKF